MRCSSRYASIKVFQQQPGNIGPTLDHDVQALLWSGPCNTWVGYPDNHEHVPNPADADTTVLVAQSQFVAIQVKNN